MKDFDLRKYLAEGKIYENTKEEIKAILTKSYPGAYSEEDFEEIINLYNTKYKDHRDWNGELDGVEYAAFKFNYANNRDIETGMKAGSKSSTSVDFPEMEDEFEGAMSSMSVSKEEYLQDIINASADEIVSDDYFEIKNAVEQGVYSEDEAVKLAKAWAKEKLLNLSEGKLLNEVELTDDLVQRVAQAIADEFTAEDRELDLKYVITPNSIEAYPDGGGFDLDVNAGPNTPGEDWKDSRGFGIANYLGDYAGGSFVIRPEGKGHLVTNAASGNAKVAYITPEGEIEIISAEDSKADLGMTDDVETDYMERRKEMSDYMNESYTPGSGWTKDFDYDGMLRAGLKTGTHYDIKLLKKIAEDFTDVNYHREAAHLYDAIEAMEEGAMKEAGMFFGDFHSEINKTLNENTIKERKTISKNKTKMKKSELKEMIKMALSEDARTDAEQEGYKDGFEDAKDDIEDKLKDMKVSEAEEVDVEDNEKVDVDIEKDVEVDDESVETDIDVKGSMPGENEDEIAVQSLLMKAQEEAEKLGDEKLTDQIGNTITYFTRAHVATVDEDVNEETDYDNTDAVSGDINVTNDNPAADAEIGLALNEEVARFKKLAGIIK